MALALEALLADRRLWRGPRPVAPTSAEPTGHAVLDAALPSGGWPPSALIEVLQAADGLGELRLLLPTLARHTAAGRTVVLVAPPYVPHPHGWLQAGVDMRQVAIVQATPRDQDWATEQCLRSGCVSVVVGWPRSANDKTLRRLQVAAETGRCLGFVLRDARHAVQASPAAVRVQVAAGVLRVLKCRGGLPPARELAFPGPVH